MKSATPKGAATAARAQPDAARAWRYDAVLDEELSTLVVTLCFEGPSSPTLIPGQTFAYQYLREAALIDDESARTLTVSKRGIEMPAGSEDDCVRYTVDVEAAADSGDRDIARRVGGDLVLTHDVWLWRPSVYDDDAVVRARWSLPSALAISTPWQPASQADPRDFDVPLSTLRRRGYTAFGRFRVKDIEIPGGTLHVAVLDGPLDNGHAPVMEWLTKAGASVSQLYGRFPREHTQVMVTPTAVGSGALFGWVVRGGGPSVNLLVGRWSDEKAFDLDDEWVAVHEMSHLAIPYVGRGEPWLSEGLATWYQNVARARSGDISERAAWEKLLDGFARGRASLTGRTLREDSSTMYANASFLRVYWAGTALIMLADVELRRISDGKRSLDFALEGLSRCCLDSDDSVTALHLCARIDELTGNTVFSDVARAGREDRTFPDTDGVLRALGVIDVRGRLVLDDRAPLAHIRRQIMSPKEVTP